MNFSIKMLSLFIVLFLSLPLFSQTVMEVGYFSFNENSPDFTLSKGEGDRTVSIEVRLTKPFTSKPEIVFSVEQIDCSNEANLRYSIESSLVTKESFLLKIKTWWNTKIFSIKGKWVAISSD